MALLGLLVADQGRVMTAGLLNVLLMANPADVYRLLNFTGFSELSQFAGMAGISKQVYFGFPVLAAVLAAWIAIPLAGAAFLFKRREL
jgi:Cu-processing system permease protein